jgi:integrase
MSTATGFFTLFAPASTAPPSPADGPALLQREQMPHASLPPLPPPPVASRVTVKDLLQIYEKDYLPELAPSTQHSTKLLYKKWLPAIGHLPLSDLTPAWLRQWRDAFSLERPGIAPSTVNRYLAALAAPLTVAVRDLEWLTANPAHKVRKKPEPSGRVRFLSDDERQRLLSACLLSHNPHLYTIVLLALTTGARKNEMRQLKWADVDLDRGVLRLATTKNKERRSVPVRGEALRLLRKQGREQQPEAWVFPRWDRRQPVLIEQAWQTAKRRAELTDFHFHDLRHSAASYFAASGATLLEIATILGHKNLRMTFKYAHLTSEHSGDVIERMVQHKVGLQEESLYARTR